MERPALSSVFGRVRAPTTYEETVARLGTAIRVGLLAAGSRLPPERELAEQLGISRSTLRQALHTLTQSGHLVAVRGRCGGTFIADAPPISSGDPHALERWRELLDWRIAIELGAVRLAAERAEAKDRERLTGHVLAMGAAAGWPAYRRADVSFHIAIAEAARAPRVVAAMTALHGELAELLDRIAHPPTVLGHSNDQHASILAALRERDSQASVARMREHLESTERIVEGLLP